MPFKQQLKRMGINPDEYLKIAKNTAKRNNLDPDKLTFSSLDNKKLNYDGVNFGAYGYNDYIIYTLLKDPKADVYRKRYQISHKAIKGDWNNKISPNYLSLNINW